MTIEKFKQLFSKEIKMGVILIGDCYIITDRFDGVDMLIDRKLMDKIQQHIRNMGYIKVAPMGLYIIPTSSIIEYAKAYKVRTDLYCKQEQKRLDRNAHDKRIKKDR